MRKDIASLNVTDVKGFGIGLVNVQKDLVKVSNGYSGLGKSTALSVAANKYRAVYVACRSYDTKKSLLTSITHEMGIEPGRATVPEPPF